MGTSIGMRAAKARKSGEERAGMRQKDVAALEEREDERVSGRLSASEAREARLPLCPRRLRGDVTVEEERAEDGREGTRLGV